MTSSSSLGAAALIRKLEQSGPLPAPDRELIAGSIGQRILDFAAGQSIIKEGDPSASVRLVISGVAQRSKVTDTGRRQVFAFLLPGDLCDSHVFKLGAMDHDIAAVTTCEIALISRDQMIRMMSHPAIARAMWISTMIDEATLREWLVNLGQRESEERVAHMICEIHFRMQTIGLATDNKFSFPVTQALLADAMGISTVHANRVLQSLKRNDLMSIIGGVVSIPDVRRLRNFCGFRSNYLHLSSDGSDQS